MSACVTCGGPSAPELFDDDDPNSYCLAHALAAFPGDDFVRAHADGIWDSYMTTQRRQGTANLRALRVPVEPHRGTPLQPGDRCPLGRSCGSVCRYEFGSRRGVIDGRCRTRLEELAAAATVTARRAGYADLRTRLAEFEHTYGMSTSEFLERWDRGELDSHDSVVWAGLSCLANRARTVPPAV